MTDRTLIYYALLWVVIGIVSAGIYIYAPAQEIPYGTYLRVAHTELCELNQKARQVLGEEGG